MKLDALIPFLMVGGILAAIGLFVWWAHVMEKKRREALAAMAEQMGLMYKQDGDGELHQRIGGFSLFNQGHSRKLYNVILGETDEVRIAIFDYQYTTGSGKHKTTHSQTVASLESPRLHVPDFSMRPEGFFDKIGGVMGFQDIDFEDHPEFSNAFVLKGPDEDRIRRFFNKDLLDFFAEQKGCMVEAESGRMIYYRKGRRKPDELQTVLSEAYQIYGMIVDRDASATA
ncbi:MAG: hypothetical protein R3C03_15155 [Pirellulaceae bacterium]